MALLTPSTSNAEQMFSEGTRAFIPKDQTTLQNLVGGFAAGMFGMCVLCYVWYVCVVCIVFVLWSCVCVCVCVCVWMDGMMCVWMG